LKDSAARRDVVMDGPSCKATSSKLTGAAMLQQLCCHQQEAACLLTAVVVDGHAKCNYSRYIGYMPTQSIIAVRNDVQIIDVHLTTLSLMPAQAAQKFTSIR